MEARRTVPRLRPGRQVRDLRAGPCWYYGKICGVTRKDRRRNVDVLKELSIERHYQCNRVSTGWLGSRVVSVLDSGAEGPGFKSQLRRCRVTRLRQTVHTYCASVHQTAKLVAALLRVAGVTAGLAKNNGSLSQGL